MINQIDHDKTSDITYDDKNFINRELLRADERNRYYWIEDKPMMLEWKHYTFKGENSTNCCCCPYW